MLSIRKGSRGTLRHLVQVLKCGQYLSTLPIAIRWAWIVNLYVRSSSKALDQLPKEYRERQRSSYNSPREGGRSTGWSKGM